MNGLTGVALLSLFFILFIGSLFGCGKEQPPMEKPQVSEPVIEKRLPVNYVVCIDNSRSIRPQEQILIRETTMLLADLADLGDRISIITFGQGAQLAASTQILKDRDRIALKNKIRQQVNFTENYSDIRSGIKLLADRQQSPLRYHGFKPYVVVLSDGKLEPQDRNTEQAFNEMRNILKEQLAETKFYAVVLGNTYCKDTILRNVDGTSLNGKGLMEKYIATSSDHFFHAEDMNDLLKIVINILNKTKNITSLGERGETNQFKIDDTVELMTLIVRKKSTEGRSLFDASDIILHKPEPKAVVGDKKESIYRNSDYQYFDLMVVRNPREGIWSISLKNPDQKPEVLSKIITPLELRYDLRNLYYLNESATIRAWIFNRQTSQVMANQPFVLKAHLAKDMALEKSKIYKVLYPDSTSGQYYLNVPEDILGPLKSEGKSAKINMELISQRFKTNTEIMDPWFIRRSAAVSIEFVEPFINWQLQKKRLFRIPFIGEVVRSLFHIPVIEESLPFGADLEPGQPHYPEFEGLPRLGLVLKKFDAESNSYKLLMKTNLDGVAAGDKINYQCIEKLEEPGKYQYTYELAGILKFGGHFNIKSAPYYFEVKSFSYDAYEFWVCIVLMLLIVLCIFSSLTAKLKGIIVIDGKQEHLNTKKYSAVGICDSSFVLRAKRCCYVKSCIILKVIQGSVVADNQLIPQGQKIKLSTQEKHQISCQKDGREVKIDFTAYI